MRVYKYAEPRVVNEDGTISRKKLGARKYQSRRMKVTKRVLMTVLKNLYKSRAKMTRFPGTGHDYNGVRYAQYYGCLNKAGDIGCLQTIILSNEKKVYQLTENDKHVELKWQNDKKVLQPAYGIIKLIGEGVGYECSIASAFKTELSIYI